MSNAELEKKNYPTDGVIYPQNKKGEIEKRSWSVKELNAILKMDLIGRTLNDGGGLLGEIRETKKGAVIRFRFAFKWSGKVPRFSCGNFPDLSMTEIRANRDKARTLLESGINPIEARKASKIEAQKAIEATIAQADQEAADNADTSALFTDWINKGVDRKDGNKGLIRRFEKDVIPALGKVKVKDILKDDIIKMLLSMKQRGYQDDAQRNMNRSIEALFNDLKQMFRWAEKQQDWRKLLANHGNPCDGIELNKVPKLIDHDYTEVRKRLLSDHEIRELQRIFKKLDDDYQSAPDGQKRITMKPVPVQTQAALWICLSTLCRIGELLMSEWDHVDFAQRTWTIPAENTKAKKGQAQEQVVYLSDFALEQFKRLYAVTGESPYCFPSRDKTSHVSTKIISKQVGDRQVMFKQRTKSLTSRRADNTLVLSNGKNGEWTPHDLRRTGATLMQKMGISLDIIDRCQNHIVTASKIHRHYLHYDYKEEKAQAWIMLGDHISALLNHGNIITFNKKEA